MKIYLSSNDELITDTAKVAAGAAVLAFIGVPAALLSAGASFVASVAQYVNLDAAAKQITAMTGGRWARFTDEETSAWLFKIWRENVGRNPNAADIDMWFPRVKYGYKTLEEMTAIVQGGDESRKYLKKISALQSTAWQQIRQAFVDILGREPDDAGPEDNYFYNLLVSGQQPIEAIRKGLLESEEYKIKHPATALQKALPYIVGAGVVLSQIL